MRKKTLKKHWLRGEAAMQALKNEELKINIGDVRLLPCIMEKELLS